MVVSPISRAVKTFAWARSTSPCRRGMRSDHFHLPGLGEQRLPAHKVARLILEVDRPGEARVQCARRCLVHVTGRRGSCQLQAASVSRRTRPHGRRRLRQECIWSRPPQSAGTVSSPAYVSPVPTGSRAIGISSERGCLRSESGLARRADRTCPAVPARSWRGRWDLVRQSLPVVRTPGSRSLRCRAMFRRTSTTQIACLPCRR